MSSWQYLKDDSYTYAYANEKAYMRHNENDEFTELNGPTEKADHRKVMYTEWATEGPFTWKRRGGSTDWVLHSRSFGPAANVEATKADLCLFLVMKLQSPGEPNHWCLFVARENRPGLVYQVTGDAENMHYNHLTNIDVFQEEDFKTAYTMAGGITEDNLQWIKHYAENEIPPSAVNRAAVTENCQGWAFRVLKRLADKGIVTEQALSSVKEMMEPVG